MPPIIDIVAVVYLAGYMLACGALIAFYSDMPRSAASKVVQILLLSLTSWLGFGFLATGYLHDIYEGTNGRSD